MSTQTSTGVSDVVLVVLAIFVPPAAVFLKTGPGLHFILSILLWFMFVIPGIVHAFWIIMRK